VDVIAFGVGEPDFDTPDHIKEAAVAAMKKGCGKYTAVSGTAELRAAAANELNAVHGTKLAAENVTGGCGGDDYCPAANVTRGQMAVFLAKAFFLQ